MSLIQPTIDYIYKNPDIPIKLAMLAGSAALFNPVTTIFTGLALAQPYFNPYVEYYTTEYPYFTTTAAIASVGVTLYFGGANILLQNLQNTLASKVTISMLSIIGITFVTSYYYLEIEKTPYIYKQCFDNTLAIEITNDLVFKNPTEIYGPAIGYFLSCTIRAISRDYFLTNETNSHLKILSVSFISGGVGGGSKYGSIAAVIQKKNLEEIIKISMIGAVNHGTYASLTAYAKSGTISPIIDDSSPLIAEPLDVLVGFVLGMNSLSASNFKTSLELAFTMCSTAKILLPIAKRITETLFNMSPEKDEHQIANDLEGTSLSGDNNDYATDNIHV